METALILAQIIFYFTVSLAIIALGILCGVVVYYLIRVARELEGLSRNLHNASTEVGERIGEVLDRLSEIPFLSYFIKKRGGNKTEAAPRKRRANH